MDPDLLEILLDGVTKYLTETRQTKYIVGSKGKKKPDYLDMIGEVNGTTPVNEEHEYWTLKQIQEAIGRNNLLHSMFVNDWRELNGEYNKKCNKIKEKTVQSHRAKEKIQEAQKKGMRLILGSNQINLEEDTRSRT